MIEQIKKLVDIKLDNINTVALGVVTRVDLSKMRCNVKLKHKIQDNEIELFDVPIALNRFYGSAIIITPKEGDIVLVLFNKYELDEQLKNRDVVNVNELLKFNLNYAIVIAGVYTSIDAIPHVSNEEILIWHRSGAYIKFFSDGSIEIRAKSVNIREDLSDGEINSNKRKYF